MDVNEEIEQFVKYSQGEVYDSPRLRQQLERLTVFTTGFVICTSCGGEIKKAWRNLQRFFNQGKKVEVNTKEKVKTMSQFQLKSLTYFREPVFEHFSNKNITDEKAIAILKANAKRIHYFSKYPENWQQLVDGTATVSAVTENIFKTEEGGELAAAGEVEEIVAETKKPGRKKKEQGE